ncbi:cytochrome P450 [Vararia minispora EC-137]|uniref:Cytochrome P450 n=1 Tax=Vararia minispora EC-137 TaxID=1314806 RepID=A0ACB8QBX3_9AGAM|nr:cytochrome P450 [Vararia minispora EC-137]
MVLLVAMAVLFCVFTVNRIFSRKDSYPPGPPGLPLVGNLFDLPKDYAWIALTRYGKKYGDLVHLNVLGQHIIVINSYRAAVEMLDRKGSIYSDRPTFVMGSELCGYTKTLPLTPYGQRTRTMRRLMHKFMGTGGVVQRFDDVLQEEVQRLMTRILRDPREEHLEGHLTDTTGAILLRLAYGVSAREENDPYLLRARSVMKQFFKAIEPGAFLVDTIPWLRYIPWWMPGSGFLKTAAEWRENYYKLADEPMLEAQQKTPNSFVAQTVQNDVSEDEQEMLKFTAATIFAGMLARFIRRIKLDDVFDCKRMPFVNAVVTEVLRWNVVGPLGVPHQVIQNDVQDGYVIPKGTTILANIYCMLSDEELYPNPQQFDPSRFLPDDVRPLQRDPRDVAFGFGRRHALSICLTLGC